MTKSNTKLIATWYTDEEQTLMPAHKHASDIEFVPNLGDRAYQSFGKRSQARQD